MSAVYGCSWFRSSPTPKKPYIVPRLWVPDTQRLDARNWNFAASGAAFTASRVANRVAVSTPLRVALSVTVIDGPFGCAWWRVVDVTGWSDARSNPCGHHPGTECGTL